MNEEPTSIQCGEHGEAAPTYVCGHLCRHPVQRWFCDAPSPDTPYPDAWCASCHTELLKTGGEWNEHNADCLDLQILCHHSTRTPWQAAWRPWTVMPKPPGSMR